MNDFLLLDHVSDSQGSGSEWSSTISSSVSVVKTKTSISKNNHEFGASENNVKALNSFSLSSNSSVASLPNPIYDSLTRNNSYKNVGATENQNDVQAIQSNEEVGSPKASTSRREFRPRRPEQTMPYTYDFLRHKLEFKKMGLAPISVPHGVEHTTEQRSVAHRPVNVIVRRNMKDKETPVNDTRKTEKSPNRLRKRHGIVLSDSDDEPSNVHRPQTSKSNDSIVDASEASHISDVIESHVSDQDDDSGGESSSSYSSMNSSTKLSPSLNVFKKRLKGVLPPSFLTLQGKRKLDKENANLRSNDVHKRNIDSVDVKKKGIVRRKLNQNRKKSFSIGNSNDHEDYYEHSPPSLSPEVSHFDKEAFTNSLHKQSKSEYQDDTDRSWFANTSSIPTFRSASFPQNQKEVLEKSNTFASQVPRNFSRKRKRKNKRNYVDLGLLATHTHNATGKPAPKFLRIFSRAASKIPKKESRLSQRNSSKYFLFDSLSDQNEIEQVMDKWHRGEHLMVKDTFTKMPKTMYKKGFRQNIDPSRSLSTKTDNVKLPTEKFSKFDSSLRKQRENPQKREKFLSLFSYPKTQRQRKQHSYTFSQSSLDKLFVDKPENSLEEDDSAFKDYSNLDSNRLLSPSQNDLKTVPSIFNKLPRKQKANRILRNDYGQLIFSSKDSDSLSNIEHFFKVGSFSVTFNVVPFKSGINLPEGSFLRNGYLENIVNRETNYTTSIYAFSRHFNISDEISKTKHKLEEAFELIVDLFPEFNENCANDVYILFAFCSSYLLRLQLSDQKNCTSQSSSFLEMFTKFFDRCMSTISMRENQFIFKLNILFLMFQFIYCAQYEIISSSSRNLIRLARELINKLLSYGQSDLLECYRCLRSSTEPRYPFSVITLETWIVLNKLLIICTGKYESLWEQVDSFLSLNGPDLSTLEMEKIWYIIITVSPVFQFNDLGITGRPISQSYWPLVLKTCRSTFERQKKGIDLKVTERYLRVLLLRINLLISDWFWSEVTSVLTAIFDFFSHRKFTDLSCESSEYVASDFPDFIKSLDRSPDLHISALDTCFVIFLKTVIISIQRLKCDSNNTPIIRRMVARLQPLHARQYKREIPFSIKDYMSLEHTHTLLISLFWVAPENCKPSINRIRDNVIFEGSHLKARLISLKAWQYLMRYILLHGSDVQLDACMYWLDSLMEVTLNEYLSLILSDQSLDEIELIAYSQGQLENFLLVAFYSLQALVPNHTTYVRRINCLLTVHSSQFIFQNSSSLPSRVILECTYFLKKFLTYHSICQIPHDKTVTSVVFTDSQDAYFENDYIDDTELMIEQEKFERICELAKLLRKHVSPYLYQTISTLVGSDESEYKFFRPVLIPLIECMALCASFAVEAKINDWSYYVDFGSESWERIRNTRLKRSLSSQFYSILIETNVSFLVDQREKVMTVWFESLGALNGTYAASFTLLLLEKDKNNPLLFNLPIILDNQEEFLRQFKSIQLSLISSVLGNMAKVYDDVKNNHMERLQYYQILFLQYLSSLLASMQNSYESLVYSNDDHSIFISSAQRVVGDILQYCSPFANEKNLAGLRYFMDSARFPQPPERLEYAAFRLRSYARKNLASNSSRSALFGFLKANFDIALLEQKQKDITNLLTLAMGSYSQDVNDYWDFEVSALRRFCLKELLLNYLSDKSLVASFYSSLLLDCLTHVYNSFQYIYLREEHQIKICEEVYTSMSVLENLALLYSSSNPVIVGKIYLLFSAIAKFTLVNTENRLVLDLQNYLGKISREFLLELCWILQGQEYPPPFCQEVSPQSKLFSAIEQHCTADWYENFDNIVHKVRKTKLHLLPVVEQEYTKWNGLIELFVQIWKRKRDILEPELETFFKTVRLHHNSLSSLPFQVNDILARIDHLWIVEDNDLHDMYI
ncbi:DNA repair protein Mus7/Mms22 [Schizosaccharomyces cryophilus OY26]|uniref:DNA repair protein Mus7/Mms22 n=1 Tax=Schizosaccharomyces cryophilus (strain OY26 / ATCC MYA-4695 / CBS 11777 / NBRC 106824 / NRRL Y48691) TaxID=653667 RepID=S9VW79_SCHCR|nr:DNA repair protein Mus7/Mms22 [Schizosaccharomyces cryophilus OY26]EPY51868.1 DNA repair protein Mus7/Mms22 [Schizosaccharomyces cryophilus OY26]